MDSTSHILLYLVCLSVIFHGATNVSGQREDVKSFVLSCGNKDGGTDIDGRKWESDEKYFKSKASASETAQYQDPSLDSQIPYMTARTFTSEATYTFPISSKNRYFVRLHFYPSDYSTTNVSACYFSVVAAGVTLLRNFSASITAQALTQVYLVREFSLASMDSASLDITFKPGTGDCAFVNGIEVIPTPHMFDSAVLVGFSNQDWQTSGNADQTFDTKSANLQTMLRLNVGGQYIPANNDSAGLARAWYDDFPYLYSAASGISLRPMAGTKFDYQDLPQYAAPLDVYSTARGMGGEKGINLQYNLTWKVPVDPNFTYVVRLHFCDFLDDKANQKVFNIFINNQTAQPGGMDIIAVTGGKAVPMYKDYAIFVDDVQGVDNEEIQLDLHPATDTKPEYYDAQLNGLEIFKISDANNSLAGPNPQPSDMLINAESQENNKSFQSDNNTLKIIGGAAAGGAAAFVAAAVGIAVYRRKRRFPGTDSQTSSWLPLYGNSQSSGTKSTISGKSTASSHISNPCCRRFSLPEILQGTKNFDDSNVIGVGGFGKVYKGTIDGGATKVAIKRSNPSSEQGVNEFQTEIEMLSKLRHKHLVSLIGFCEEEGEMCLVYDYMALGTLREHLYNTKKPHLSWKQRLEICIGAARGLHYLHTGAKYTIIHRDVKTTNILLDEKCIAKVSDFGLSKTGPNMNNGHVTTVVKGSFGYLDPEYFRRQQLTDKSDVYSFGVVLFEVLCARPALNPSLPKEQVSLADWATLCQRRGTLADSIDPHLKGKISPECLKKFATTAEKCLMDIGVDRPTMGDVLWNLEFALHLQEEFEGTKRPKGGDSNDSDDESQKHQTGPLHISNLSLGSEPDVDQSDDSGHIFSQLVHPQGR